MGDKRHQVFISSTYTDLREHRQEVVQALLELDCIPVGMELFPAADSDAWSLITRIIKSSDYYIVIIGNRYGSTDGAGLSYTEREYDFAVNSNVPVLTFLHEKPESIPFEKSDKSPELQEALKRFRSKLEEAHHVKYWKTPEDLSSKVSRGLVNAFRESPRQGWVRAEDAVPHETLVEIAGLNREIESLRTKLNEARVKPPPGTEDLAQGSQLAPVKIFYHGYSEKAKRAIADGRYQSTDLLFTTQIGLTWDEVFASVGPLLFDESAEPAMKAAVVTRAIQYHKYQDEYEEDGGQKLGIADDQFQTIKVQFLALGLITKSDRKRGVRDKATYWTLTPYGEQHLMKLRAIRANASEDQ